MVMTIGTMRSIRSFSMFVFLGLASGCFFTQPVANRPPTAAAQPADQAQPSASGLPTSNTPVAVVPASEAPHPPGGPGFYCVQYRPKFASKMISYCSRESVKCEGEAKALRDRGKMDLVTSCRKLEEAACFYEWLTNGPSRHRCFVDKAECDRHTIKVKTVEEKLSECRLES